MLSWDFKKMNQAQFIQLLKEEGFPDPVTIEKPQGHIGQHTHAFEAKALILSGQLDIDLDGKNTTYLMGDIFHLQANQVHAESYGPQGVKYLVGRKELT